MAINRTNPPAVPRNLSISRRRLLACAAGAVAAPPRLSAAPVPPPLLTPHKTGRLVLPPSSTPGAFDEKAVDSPFLFYHEGRYRMLHIGFDGKGYQTGLASSTDLLNWTRDGIVFGRRPDVPLLRYNAALSWILRDNDVFSRGELKKVRGRYVGAYHAYPLPGYEEGPAVIGLCWSKDLRSWEVEPPCLRSEDGAEWERGGLYKPCLVEDRGTFYIFYNAKNRAARWREQTGVATSRDLKTWERLPANPILRNGGEGSPDEIFASDPCVLRFRDQWAMFYFGLDRKGAARDLLALSSDLVRTEKCPQVLIDVGPKGSIDERYAHKPSMICADGNLYHFYCAVSAADVRGISVATSSVTTPAA